MKKVKMAIDGFVRRRPRLAGALSALSAIVAISCYYLIFTLPESTGMEIAILLICAANTTAFFSVVLFFSRRA